MKASKTSEANNAAAGLPYQQVSEPLQQSTPVPVARDPQVQTVVQDSSLGKVKPWDGSYP